MPPDDHPIKPGLPTALLISASGGLLDAVTYLVHHGVFSSALSGNLVLLGVDLLQRNITEAVRHLVPIAATVVGVFCARAIRVEPSNRAANASLLLESAILLLSGLLSHFLPGQVIVASIAFAGAFQVTNFRHIHQISYNSTFITGDLRDMSEGCFEALNHARDANAGTRQRGRKKARDLGLITLAFLAGVALGAALSPSLGDRAFWADIPLLLAALPAVQAALTRRPAQTA